MSLFNNPYFLNNHYYCDLTEELDYVDPASRVYCFGFGVGGGTIGCPDLILQNGLIHCGENQDWNCNLCGNDMPFWIPFGDDDNLDTFDFQFQQLGVAGTAVGILTPFGADNLIGSAPVWSASVSFEIRTCCDDEVFELTAEMQEAIVLESYVGYFSTQGYSSSIITTPIQLVRFNLMAIANYLLLADKETCFYFVFKFPASAQGYFNAPNQSGTLFFTAPFQYQKCDGFPYMYKIESKYSALDCFGNYYGNNFSQNINLTQGTPFVYSNALKVLGSFEQQSFEITKEKINATLKTVATQICENWLLRTTNMPIQYAKFVSNVLGGKEVHIDGVEYQVEGELSKNNDTGNQFYMEIPAINCNCNKSLSCE